MTYKIIEVLKFIRGKTLHIFLCLVLIFAFCFRDSVPSAQAVNSEHFEQTDGFDNSEETDGTEAAEAVTVFTESAPILAETSILPPNSEAAAEETETQAVTETEIITEDTTSEEETTPKETTPEATTEEITETEETTPQTTTEEAIVTAAEELSSPSFPLNSQYGQRYQEQWEIDYANQLFDLVNNERAKYGVAPLKKMDALTAAATERAWEVTRYNSHTRPDGTSCFTILPQYGLKLSSRAENIAYYSRTPQAAFNNLMGDYAHRDPMLNAKFEYMGVGFYCVYDDAGGYHYYWTQMFYTP